MSEQEKMDEMLREAMGALPTPSLPADFDKRVMKGVRPRRLDVRGRWAMGGYVVVALVLAIWTMREGGMDWGVIAIAVIAPLGLALGVQRRQRNPRG